MAAFLAPLIPPAVAAAPHVGRFALRWLLPLIASMLGRKISESSEGPIGQIGGTLLEFGGLGTLGGRLSKAVSPSLGRLGTRAAQSLPHPTGKLGRAARRVVRKNAPSSLAGAVAFSPFIVPQALSLAEQPLVPEGLGDLESAMALLQGATAGDEQAGSASADLQLLSELLGGNDEPRDPNIDLLNLLLGGRDLVL